MNGEYISIAIKIILDQMLIVGRLNLFLLV